MKVLEEDKAVCFLCITTGRDWYLLQLLDDFLILVEVWLVCSINTYNGKEPGGEWTDVCRCIS